ncbi:MAG: hypothetical protein L0Y66_04520 [Myxococcaceae bacterium]|nr:hypothetical protein [Myxococcaceae bacterium]MCI0668988.1 hypothetical protein [Myxococcaceae bacterium]
MTAAFHTPDEHPRKHRLLSTLPGRRASVRRKAAAVALLTLLTGGTALAYVLPQGSILRRLVAARSELQLSSLKLEGTFTLSGAALRQAGGTLGLPTDRAEAQADGTFAMKLPGRCRVEAGRVTEGQGLVAVQSGARRKSAGVELTPLNRGLAEVCALLAMRTGSDGDARGALEAHLRSIGVEPRITSLARFGGKVAYVLGSRAEGKAQLWVYKDSFQPARLRWTEKDGTAWDVWMLDYASPATGESFPRIFEVHQNGERQVRFNALRTDTRARLDDALFAVQ